jgi:hypothetical protein
MTRQEFVERFRHEISGMVLDAIKPRDGAELAVFVRNIMRKVDAVVGQQYDALQPEAKAPQNGAATQARK